MRCLNAIEKETNVRPQIWAASSIAEVFENLKIEFEQNRKNTGTKFYQKLFTRTQTPCCQHDSQRQERLTKHTQLL